MSDDVYLLGPSGESGAVTEAPSLKLISWNMAGGSPVATRAYWPDVETEIDQGVDLALLQETPDPWDKTLLDVVPPVGSFWGIDGRYGHRAAITRLSERVRLREIPSRPLAMAGPSELGVSRPGTLTAATVELLASGEEFTVVSVYGQWEKRGPSIYADGSMHRVLSDISWLLTHREHPVIVAGDFNSVLGSQSHTYGGNWTARNAGVFDRMAELDLRLAGPQHPNGRQAAPRPDDLPPDTKNVPTFVTREGNCVSQLDYCYVTPELVDRVAVTALNRTDEEWGPSDHCRIAIEVGPPAERLWTEEAFLAEIEVAHGSEERYVAAQLLAWTHDQGLRVEFGRGDEGQWWAQLDEGPVVPQFTFSVRTRGDVVVQFQWLKKPFDDTAAREQLRRRLNELEGVDITPDRLNGRPTVPLRALAIQATREGFLSAFANIVARTRAAME